MFNKYSKKVRVISLVGSIALGGVLLSACGGGGNQSSAINNDQITSAQALVQLQKAEPTPVFKYSQLRETLIEIETAQSNTTQTTSFFFNMGESNPTFSCPSIGFPIASTTQLTNPSQITQNQNDNGQTVIPQVDPTGVYTGASTGTYVVCVNNNGTTYLDYWEGFVQTVSGPAVWSNGAVKLTGPSTVTIKTGKTK